MTASSRAPASHAVVFDFDGVLADTEHLHLRAFQDVFARRRWVLDDRTYFDRYLGYDDAELVRAYGRDQALALEAATVESIVQEKSEGFAVLMASGHALFPGAARCVASMAGRFDLAIASGSLRAEIEHVLDAGSLRRFFPVIVGADDVARTKPAPDPYLEAVRRVGVVAGAAVAVEDSRWGLAAARAAGLRTIGITNSYPAEGLPGAEVIVDSLDALTPDLVEDLLARPARRQP